MKNLNVGVSTLIALLLLVSILPLAAPGPAYAADNPAPVQTYYLPFPEDQLLLGLQAIENGGAGNTPASPVTNYVSLACIANGTYIYYDQWEDGYAADIANPTPTEIYSASNLDGVQIWGDGDTANGAPPGVTSDLINAGTVILLQNAVDTSTRQAVIDFDGQDKLAASKNVAVTRTAWASGSGTLLAGSLEVFDTNLWGTTYRAPVGVNIPDQDTTTGSQILYPSSDVQFGSWTTRFPTTPVTNWDKIDDPAGSSDDATTYIQSTGTLEYQAGSASPTVPADATNISVSIIWRARDTQSGNDTTITSRLRVNGTYYTSTTSQNPRSDQWTTYTDTWATNPAGGAWTPATVNTINGLAFDASNNTGQRITQGYIQITYNLAAAIPGDFQMFEYTGLAVMAGPGGATISVDANADGDYADAGDLNNVTLAEGESGFVNGGVNVGAMVVSNNPVQVDILTGDIASSYESRDSQLLPTDLWTNRYYTPVSTPDFGTGDSRTTAWLYNPGASAITVTYQRRNSAGTLITSSIAVPAGGYAKQILDQPTNGTAAQFSTDGAPFYAFSTTDSASSTTGNNQAWDWGFSLIPQESLTPQLIIGLGIGQDPTITPQTENGNPVWVTTVGNGDNYVTVYVDYNGDNAPGTADPNGNYYDASYNVRELDQLKLFDPDGDQTAMVVYVLDTNVRLAGAWGQDPTVATAGAPGLDVGTGVPPMPLWGNGKDGTLYDDPSTPGVVDGDLDGDGVLSPGDVVLYTITINNISRVPVPDFVVRESIPDNTTYVPNSTFWGATAIPDNTGSGTPFPLDDDGTDNGYDDGYMFPTPLLVNGTFVVTFRVAISGECGDLMQGVCQVVNRGSGYSVGIELPFEDTTRLYCSDLGDLPASYGTLVANDGPRHSKSGLRLGDNFDRELDGQPVTNAKGDDDAETTLPVGDDEDGVANAATPNEWAGGTGAFDVTVTGGPGCLNAWMDFTNDAGDCPADPDYNNADGNFTKTSGGYDVADDGSKATWSEHIIDNYLLTTALTEVPVSVPPGLNGGSPTTFYLRFRLSPPSGSGTPEDPYTCSTAIAPTGFVSGGEVEDYLFDLGAPTAIDLVSFTARAHGQAILLTWETANEFDNLGFNLYRAESPDGPQTQITDGFIPSQGPGSPTGFVYTFLDETVTPGVTYYYWLEDVNIYGAASRHGPETAFIRPAAPFSIYLPSVVK